MLVTIRPEDIAIVNGDATLSNIVEAEVLANVYVGTRRHLVVTIAGREWHLEGPSDAPFSKGDLLSLRLAPDQIWLLPASETGRV